MLISRIDSRFVRHDASRICQGDILRDLRFQVVQTDESVAELDYPYAIVMTQDCDLEQTFGAKSVSIETGEVHNQFLPNVLLTPAFPADSARSGEHLLEIFGVRQDRINSDRWKLISQNREDRYHHLLGRQDMQIPELLIDFKQYFTISHETVFSATLTTIWQRLTSYSGRSFLVDSVPTSLG